MVSGAARLGAVVMRLERVRVALYNLQRVYTPRLLAARLITGRLFISCKSTKRSRARNSHVCSGDVARSNGSRSTLDSRSTGMLDTCNNGNRRGTRNRVVRAPQ
jgi:hypothetical protein